MNKDALSKLKLKNKLSHRYLRTNNPQDYETYQSTEINQNKHAENLKLSKKSPFLEK